MPFAIGENVGPYKILEELGQGGMASVYKAYHANLGRHVAIKVLHADVGSELESIERFKLEARIVANLDNPHIVPIFDFDEHNGQPYLVLKIIEGQTLRDRMQNSPLSDAEILEMVLAVGEGLTYAHSQGVLHRDIKPSNVLLARDGKIYIADFGLARIVEGNSSLTGEMIVGTPHYMSPEQALGIAPLDEGTDIYSFGVMIYEMILGRLPFDSTDPFSIISDLRSTPPVAPRSIKPGLSVELEMILLKALAKRRTDRYTKVADLIRDFTPAWMSSTNQKSITSTTMESFGIAVLATSDGKAFPLTADKTVLGRNSSTKNIQNDIDLTELDTKKIISRRHAMVDCQNGKYLLYDLNSRNGTFLNGKRIAPQEPQQLTTGDVIEFGSGGVKLTFG